MNTTSRQQGSISFIIAYVLSFFFFLLLYYFSTIESFKKIGIEAHDAPDIYEPLFIVNMALTNWKLYFWHLFILGLSYLVTNVIMSLTSMSKTIISLVLVSSLVATISHIAVFYGPVVI